MLYEDNHIAVVVKPQGMPVFSVKSSHSIEKSSENSIAGYNLHSVLIYNLDFDSKGITNRNLHRPRPVHRLDKSTGGCIVAAKTFDALQQMSAMFADSDSRSVTKEYRALVFGDLRGNGTIDYLIDKKTAITHYESLFTNHTQLFGPVTTLRIMIETGRNHQIRKHLAMIGHPIIGDKRYTFSYNYSQSFKIPSFPENIVQIHEFSHIFLWSVAIKFEHPTVKDKFIDVRLEEPDIFKEFRTYYCIK